MDISLETSNGNMIKDWDLYDAQGNRKYLTAEERQKFYDAIPDALGREKRTFALMLYYSGCRISEALEVTCSRIDYDREGVVFRTLKRKKQVFRFVPLPSPFLEKLDDVHHVKDVAKKKSADNKIWSFNRKTGWSAIKSVMEKAGIEGAQATAHGLRHSFVIAHQQNKTPPHMIQEWAGWSSTQMLGVYGRAFGEEERNLASQIW
ncbi:MAG: site-specific integrase [Bacteroidota bacterium]